MKGDAVLLLLPKDGCEKKLREMTWRAPEAYPPDEATKYGVCPLSGLPAKYRDPATGVRYGNLAAFKQLRANAAAGADAAAQTAAQAAQEAAAADPPSWSAAPCRQVVRVPNAAARSHPFVHGAVTS